MARAATIKTKHPGVYRRRPDNRIIIRAKVISPKTGKPLDREQLCPAGTTLVQAVRLRAGLIEQVKAGLDAVNEIPNLRDYANRWATRKAERGDWREGSTSEPIITGIIRNHILPPLGDILLDRLTTADLQAWMDKQVASGGRFRRNPATGRKEPTAGVPSTIKLRWGVVSALVRDACAEYRLLDPSKAIKPPKVRKKRGRNMVLMPVDIARFVADVEEREAHWLPLVLLGFSTGARPSELISVKVGDLDLDLEDDDSGIGTWTIAQHIGYCNNLLGGTKTTDDEPRVAYLDPNVTLRLRELLAGRFPAEFVLPGGTSAGCYDKSAMTDMLRRVARRLGLEGRGLAGKVFRQTHTTLSRIQGIPDIAIQAQLGHQSSLTTDIYSRIPEAARRDIAARMGGIIPEDDE